MSKSDRKSHRDESPSKGRNLDLQAMFANPKGGAHENRRDKRKGNPKNHWENEES